MSFEVEAAPQWLDKAGSYRTDCTLLMNRPAAMRAAQMDSRLKTLTLTHIEAKLEIKVQEQKRCLPGKRSAIDDPTR